VTGKVALAVGVVQFMRDDLNPRLMAVSRGDRGAVRAEKPDGGFEVRTTGGHAASSSRSRGAGGPLRLLESSRDDANMPYWLPKLPLDDTGDGHVEISPMGMSSDGPDRPDRLVIRDEMTSGEDAAVAGRRGSFRAAEDGCRWCDLPRAW
jgi:hypothetical protein